MEEQHPGDGSHCSVPLGSLFGVHIRVDWSYFLILFMTQQLAALRASDLTYSLFVFVLFGPVVLITIYLHKMGHVAVARCLGGRVKFIKLWICGGLGYFGPGEKVPGADLLVTIAGPVMHAKRAS
eukprot:scaffold421529_cov71-Attheya_sp.AAC.4